MHNYKHLIFLELINFITEVILIDFMFCLNVYNIYVTSNKYHFN